MVQAGERIQAAVMDLDAFRRARAVGLYLARPREVPTATLIAACRAAGKTVCVPAFRKDTQRYAMSRWDEGVSLRAGHYGILEPVEPAWVPVDAIDVMLVTALAFDEYGWRLGHGGGHFDRLLADHRGTRIALAFECQKLAAVPSEDHDIPMNLVVTEQRIYHAPGRLTYADPAAWKKH